MKLHEQEDVFAELIGNAAEIIGLPQIYVEKDYWVTTALKCLSESDCAEQAIFKGGTSLSKASADIACATRDDGRSPLFALWSTQLREEMA